MSKKVKAISVEKFIANLKANKYDNVEAISALYTSFDCKESALLGRFKKLSTKVKAFAANESFDQSLKISFFNMKSEDHGLVDGFDINSGEHSVVVYPTTKSAPGYVGLVFNGDDFEFPTWTEAKAFIKDAAFGEGETIEVESEDEAAEVEVEAEEVEDETTEIDPDEDYVDVDEDEIDECSCEDCDGNCGCEDED